jgi:hypothetical protein
MPANQKTFEKINLPAFETFCNHARGKGWTPPAGPVGYLRGAAGLHADVTYDEKVEELRVSVRNPGKGETYGSFFDSLQSLLQIGST